MIIPHDHHQADSDFCNENPYPVSKTGTTHHPVMPGHCHAFNVLASEKVNSCFNNIQIPVRDLIQDFTVEPKHCEQQLSFERIVNISIRPVLKGLPGLSSLRAPPSLV
jgi:hypothetical protein